MRNFFNFRRSGFLLIVLLSFSLSFLAVSCSEFLSEPEMTEQLNQQDEGLLSKENPIFRSALAVQEKHTARLMNMDEVVGTAIGLTEAGEPCLLVLTKTDISNVRGEASLPSEIESVPVRIMVTGELIAFKGQGGGGGGISYTAKQTPPIQLGTSGGWRYDLANGYCCGGTLGSLVQIGGNKYILSNYHVLESDIVPGGNGIVATTGDPVIQPGLIDVSCNASNAQDVATLVVKHALPGSNVDAAVAQIIPGMVADNGSILGIGVPSSQIVSAAVNQAVKKSGRTTGLTRSSVSGLNATVSITYSNECAGGTSFTKTFTGQVVIANRGSRFLAGGDSGSLMVEDVTTNPRAVGLLFAGSSVSAIANPIGQVLSFLGASMVGN
jgi:hypothetical protein